MGMSASQARFLSLTARKNNVEFAGQQINQQRTTLANESASYYSELCNMEVPTPPSIDDYTKVSYTFNDGAMTNTVISLLPKIDSNGKIADNSYVVNYIEEWQDDYSIVPAASSLVQKDGSKFKIGDTTLRKIENLTDSQIDALTSEQLSSKLGADEYAKTLSDDQKKALLKNESYYLSMVQSEVGDEGGFYIRYVKNTTTGNYEPYFYSESELKNEQKYTNKNLGSIPCYTLGSTTKTKEVLNQSCTIEQDASGRYVALTLDYGKTYTTEKVITDWVEDTAAIEAWEAEKPKEEDYTTLVHGEPEETINENDALYRAFIAASESCYKGALNYQPGCYRHVLSHILDLELDSANEDIPDESAYMSYSYYDSHYTDQDFVCTQKTYKSSICPVNQNYDYVIFYEDLYKSAIYENHHSDEMKDISDAVCDGYDFDKDGENETVMVEDWGSYQNIDGMTAKALEYLSDEHINNIENEDPDLVGWIKLLSNYYKDESTKEVKKKTLKQKCIDILYLLDGMREPLYTPTYRYNSMPNVITGVEGDSSGSYAVYRNIMLPLLYSFQKDMAFSAKSYTEGEDEEEFDEEAYNAAIEEWEAKKPEPKPVYGDKTIVHDNGSRRFPLTTVTTTDEEAYNDAMNQYTYKMNKYDHKIQEINSKLEIIQQQDKQLELKLKQLDTEENAISTEMEAVKKVVSKNIESSFKTFNA